MPDMSAFYSMASRAKHARDAAMKRILSADPLIGSEWSAPACSFFAVVIPGHEKRFRICYFDADGFSGHAERDEPAAELFSMFGSQVEAWPGALETLSAGWKDDTIAS